MAQTPFDEVPRSQFLTRMVLPCLALFTLTWFGLGLATQALDFQPSKHLAQKFSSITPFWKFSWIVSEEFVNSLLQIEDVCWQGNAVNDFQRQKCSQYWSDLAQSGGLALTPFLVIALAFGIAQDQFKSLYRRTRKKIEQGKAELRGVVTRPALAPEDGFSWFFCLRPIMIQLPDQKQLIVYVSSDVPAPEPGQTLAAFQGLKVGSKVHYLAILYTPHVAVIRGS